jgi:hypothetical protein
MRATRAFVSTNEPLPAACALDAEPALPLREVVAARADGSVPVLPCRQPIISTERPLSPAGLDAWLFDPSRCAEIVTEQLTTIASAAPVHA